MAGLADGDRDGAGAPPAGEGGEDRDTVHYQFPARGCPTGGAGHTPALGRAENKAHWVLDVAFREDDSRIRKGDGAENVAIIRRLCLNLARLDGKKNSMRGKLKQAGWSDTRRAEVLFGEAS